MIFFSTLLISLFITISLMPLCRRVVTRLNGVDIPNHRKVHAVPIPKCGGIAMAAGVAVSVIIWANGYHLVRALMIGGGIILVFGLMDDFRNLGFKAKFAGQCAAALTVILYGGVKIHSLGVLLPGEAALPEWAAVALTLVVIVGVTNAVNLSDGLDGLAGGIALLSFIFIGYLAYRIENVPVFLFSVAVIGAIFGFLRYNTYPATLFMGDTGSQFLGFLAVTLSVSFTQENRPYSPVLPLLLLGMPVLDTAVVMVTRMARGKSPFVADMNHFHHKLMRLGLYHTEAVFVIYILQAFLVVCAFLFRYYSEWFLLDLYAAFSLLIVGGCHVALRAGWTLERPGPYDRMIKMPLRTLKDKQIAIKVSGRFTGVLLPVLLLFSCVVHGTVPAYFSWGALGCGAVLGLVWCLKRPWAPMTLRLLLYLFIPFVVFFSELDDGAWMGRRVSLVYDLSFAVLVFFVIITLKYTRRKRGFKTSPMDFLIIFIALIVPNLPDPGIKNYHMGMVAAKMIVLYFSYEVLIGELRGKVGKLVLWTLAAMVVAGAKMVL